MEGDHHSEERVEENPDQEEKGVREEHQAGQQEVDLAEVPLLEDLRGYEVPQGDLLGSIRNFISFIF